MLALAIKQQSINILSFNVPPPRQFSRNAQYHLSSHPTTVHQKCTLAAATLVYATRVIQFCFTIKKKIEQCSTEVCGAEGYDILSPSKGMRSQLGPPLHTACTNQHYVPQQPRQDCLKRTRDCWSLQLFQKQDIA